MEEGQEEGQEEGREEGREEGQEEDREHLLLVFFSRSFQDKMVEALTLHDGIVHHLDEDGDNVHQFEYRNRIVYFNTCPQTSHTYSDLIARIERIETIVPHAISRTMILHPGMEEYHFTSNNCELPPSYYIVHNLDELEQCLNLEFTAEEMQKLRPDQNIARIDITSLLMSILQGGGPPIDLTQLQDVQRPVTRTPINQTWEERLKRPREEVEGDVESTCVICMSEESVVVVVPCQHQCLCDACTKELMERDDQKKQCPVCREPIQDIWRPIKV